MYIEKELKKELVQIKDFLLSLVAALPAGVIAIDLKGLVIAANQKALDLLGKQEKKISEIIDKDIFSVIAGLPDLEKKLQECIHHHRFEISIPELRIVKENKDFFLSIIGKPIAHGMLIFLEDILEDVTVRRELQDKLAREEKLATIGKLAGIMAHEIRNPLGVIRNSIYFLNMKLKESIDEKVKRHIDILETEIESCDKIISDVLEFARTKPPSLATEEINSVVQAVLSKVNIPKTIKVETNLGENLPKINIDIAQVKQVFLNIISNAIEAMPKGGELRVTTSQTDSFISIALKDTGVGIPKENIDKLFTPLFSTKTKGLGLGLAACQNIIIAHQGKIEFESEEGQGTTFIIKLPIAQKVDTGQVPMKSGKKLEIN